MQETQRSYLSINDIQKEYIPMSKKKIRQFVVKELPYKRIGGRIYVATDLLEYWLTTENK